MSVVPVYVRTAPGHVTSSHVIVTFGSGCTVNGTRQWAEFRPDVIVISRLKPSNPLIGSPKFTLTPDPRVLPANAAPELLAVRPQAYPAPGLFVVARNDCVVLRHEPGGPVTLQPIALSVFSERSWLPICTLSTEISRVWYGEPLIADAEFPAPQSVWLAMWPPNANSTLALVALNVMRMRLSDAATVRSPRLPSAFGT